MIFISGMVAFYIGQVCASSGRKTLGDSLSTAGLSLVGTSLMLLLINFMP